MEYISKQSLLADLNEATPRSYFAFETMVREYPTEDVVPVVHAHKVRAHSQGGGTHWVVCSHCEKPIDWQDAYCKHCGAQMDEEVE